MKIENKEMKERKNWEKEGKTDREERKKGEQRQRKNK